MALPKINDSPIYNMEIPSTQKSITFRPFLVKEQKILLIAMESQDEAQILSAILNTIASCVQETISVTDLTVFDIEYMFLQLRAKSVGENAELGIECPTCKEVCSTTINLESLKLGTIPNPPQIKINDQYTLQLRYPRYSEVLSKMKGLKGKDGSSIALQLEILTQSCMDTLLTEEERIDFADETPEEINSFLDNLPTDIFDNLIAFAQDLPTLKEDVNFHCDKCNTDHTKKLEGLVDFFQYASPMKP